MPKKLLYIIAAISIAASALVAANKPAKKEPVFISASSGTATIGPNQFAVPRFGWFSCSRGMSQDFIDHFDIRLELYQNGALLQTVSTSEGGWVQSSSDPSSYCLHINEPQAAFWSFENLKLKKPGTYQLVFYYEWTVPLADGGDYDQDGFIDVVPARSSGPREVIVTVLP